MEEAGEVWVTGVCFEAFDCDEVAGSRSCAGRVFLSK